MKEVAESLLEGKRGGLNRRTQVFNKLTDISSTMIRRATEKNLMESPENNSKRDKNIEQIMKNTRVDINKAIYQLNMIQGNTDFHVKVAKGAQLTVLSGAPTFARIKVKSQAVTCTVTFTYEGYVGQLHVYASTKHKLPNERECQQTKRRPKQMVVQVAGAELLYLAVVCDNNVTVRV